MPRLFTVHLPGNMLTLGIPYDSDSGSRSTLELPFNSYKAQVSALGTLLQALNTYIFGFQALFYRVSMPPLRGYMSGCATVWLPEDSAHFTLELPCDFYREL